MSTLSGNGPVAPSSQISEFSVWQLLPSIYRSHILSYNAATLRNMYRKTIYSPPCVPCTRHACHTKAAGACAGSLDFLYLPYPTIVHVCFLLWRPPHRQVICRLLQRHWYMFTLQGSKVLQLKCFQSCWSSPPLAIRRCTRKALESHLGGRFSRPMPVRSRCRKSKPYRTFCTLQRKKSGFQVAPRVAVPKYPTSDSMTSSNTVQAPDTKIRGAV